MTSGTVCGIIAYKQPITRLEIEEIRGVNCDYAINILLEHKLIEIVGRKDAVGKPVLFGTTDEFLKRFELQRINNLEEYQKWLENVHDPEIYKELLSIQHNEEAIIDRFYKFIDFGTAGLRGVIGNGTNRMNVYTVTKDINGGIYGNKNICRHGP